MATRHPLHWGGGGKAGDFSALSCGGAEPLAQLEAAAAPTPARENSPRPGSEFPSWKEGEEIPTKVEAAQAYGRALRWSPGAGPAERGEPATFKAAFLTPPPPHSPSAPPPPLGCPCNQSLSPGCCVAPSRAPPPLLRASLDGASRRISF